MLKPLNLYTKAPRKRFSIFCSYTELCTGEFSHFADTKNLGEWPRF